MAFTAFVPMVLPLCTLSKDGLCKGERYCSKLVHPDVLLGSASHGFGEARYLWFFFLSILSFRHLLSLFLFSHTELPAKSSVAERA